MEDRLVSDDHDVIEPIAPVNASSTLEPDSNSNHCNGWPVEGLDDRHPAKEGGNDHSQSICSPKSVSDSSTSSTSARYHHQSRDSHKELSVEKSPYAKVKDRAVSPAPPIGSSPESMATTPPNFLTTPTTNNGDTPSTPPPKSLAMPSSVSGRQVDLGKAGGFNDRRPLVVKSEPQDDIKEYVETTMNELLGWYGLPKIDNTDSGNLALTSYATSEHYPGGHGRASNATRRADSDHADGGDFDTFATSVANNNNNNSINNDNNNSNTSAKTSSIGINTNAINGTDKYNPNDEGDDEDDDVNGNDDDGCLARKLANDTNNNTNSNGNSSNEDGSGRRVVIGNIYGAKDNATNGHKEEEDDNEENEDDDEDDDFDDDLNHVRDSVSCSSDISAGDMSSPGLPVANVREGDRRVLIVCSWCQKQGHKLFTLDTAAGSKVFCSEICFTQCRRASFKKNKVCDWCKHVRHTVNFVDFQDGDMQLQFCSEKCLNQYKMNIFCSEAQQHLQHMKILEEKSGKPPKSVGDKNTTGELLITPDLWLSGQDKHEIKQELPDEPPREGSVDGDSKGAADDVEHDEDDDEDEEPGELREQEKARRALMLEQGVRAALNRDRKATGNTNQFRSFSFSTSSDHGKTHGTRRVDTLPNTVDSKSRRDRERVRRLFGDGRSGVSRDTPLSGLSPSSHSAKEEAETSSTAKATTFRSPSTTPNVSFIPTSSADHLLPHWATSQLLALMPSHLNPSLNATAVGRHPKFGGYPSTALLYSSLLDAASKSTPSEATTAGTVMEESHISSPGHKRTRHESRRELLRDRDLSRDKQDRGRMRDERLASTAPPHTIAPSPTISQSSDGTPGPIINPLTPGHPPGVLSSFQRPPCPFPIPLDGTTGHSTLPSLFPDPNQAAMLLQLQMALQQGARESSSFLSPHNPPTLPTVPPPIRVQPPFVPNPPTNFTTPLQNETGSRSSHALPPVTVLVPYPIAVPIPVPIPIPIPVSPEKLMAFFKEKSEAAKPSTSSAESPSWNANLDQSETRSRASSDAQSHTSARSQLENRTRRSASPSILQPMTSLRLTRGPASTSAPLLDSADPRHRLPSGRDSADSIMTLRREIVRSHEREQVPPSSALRKRSLSPPTSSYVLDPITKRQRHDSSYTSCSEDQAMDLSKMSSRSMSPRRTNDTSEKENKESIVKVHVDDNLSGRCVLPQNLKIPKIHIVSERPDPPLAQPPVSISLPPPPEQSSYSSRRSRILDAPCVPQRSHSPSPERRYIRTVPKDMVEAAKRRGLRARVRTK